MSGLKIRIPSIEEIQDEVKARFGYSPCLFQIKDALAQLHRHDTITIAATGSGKTLTFWIPLLFNDNGIIIIITALNVLGDQNVKELERLGIPAINLTPENSSQDNVFEEIAQGLFRVIIVSPEMILTDSRFQCLWKRESFVRKLFNVSVDEAHCVSQWGATFRPEYGQLGRLRGRLPSDVRFHAVSATLPQLILDDVQNRLNMRTNTTIIRCSNDRPNIGLLVEEMMYPSSSFHDLRRILQMDRRATPPKFMVFLNKRRAAEKVVEEIWKDLPQPLHHKLVWFHSGMSSRFKEETIEALRKGEVWGLVCTDAAGMGLDLPDIEVVIQLGYVPSLCTLMQHLGRGARGRGTTARGIYLVEPMYFDRNKNKKRRRANSGNREGCTSRKARVPGADGQEDRDQGPGLCLRGSGEGSKWSGVDKDCSGVGGTGLDVGVDGGMPSAQAAPSVGDVGITVRSRGLEQQDPAFPRAIANAVRTWSPATEKSSKDFEESVMELFINAKDRGFCRRTISNKYFGNDQAERWGEQCECERCIHTRTLPTSHLCCDVCQPASFMQYRLAELPPKAPRAKRKMNVPSSKGTPYGRKLQAALDLWRATELAKEGFADEEFYGLQLLVSDEIIQRIIDLAYSGKLINVSTLIEQTDWCEVSKYGDCIFKIITGVGPAPSKLNSAVNQPAAPTRTCPIITTSTSYMPPTSLASTTNTGAVPNPSQHKKKRDSLSIANKENVNDSSLTAEGSKPRVRRQCRNCGGHDHIGKGL